MISEPTIIIAYDFQYLVFRDCCY